MNGTLMPRTKTVPMMLAQLLESYLTQTKRWDYCPGAPLPWVNRDRAEHWNDRRGIDTGAATLEQLEYERLEMDA